MKAIVYEDRCGADGLKINNVENPAAHKNEILVKVAATALNRADILQREGKYSPPQGASPILGLEISGVVEEVGQDVTKWQRGDKVFGLLPGGGYAEYAIIHEDMAMKIPRSLNFWEAAAIPEVFLTAYQSLVWHSKLKAGESVLIHAGASGVGTAAIQIVKAIGATVFVTASKEKHDACLGLGAVKAIDYKTENFPDKIKEYTGNKGVNVIIDFIAGPYFKKNIECLNEDGRLIILASLGGGTVDEFDLRQILSKRISVIGSTLRSRSLDYQIRLTKDFSSYALDKFNTGKLRPVVGKIFKIEEAAEAHKYMEANKNSGKIVLKVNDL